MSETLILLATFFGVLIVSSTIGGFVANRRQVSSRLAETATESPAGANGVYDLAEGTAHDQYGTYVRHYFDVIRKDTNQNSLPNRLIRAGYFSPRANVVYQMVRIVVSLAVFISVFLLFDLYFVTVSQSIAVIVAMMVGGFAFFALNIFLERKGVAKEKEYRLLFPDFMDMLIVCIDAGLSIEAAADRVSKEFLSTKPDFGFHLQIMMLEVRGGRRLRDALSNLATRLRIDEARSLATLFRQSEELGSSVTKSLRVYSAEMRQMRILRAEEKANALPIKMLFPLATFLFPLSLIIVLVPIVMKVVGMLKTMVPGG